jgi:hypothetical protein
MRLAIRQSPGKGFDPSLPGLTRQSILFFEKRLPMKIDGCPDQVRA